MKKMVWLFLLVSGFGISQEKYFLYDERGYLDFTDLFYEKYWYGNSKLAVSQKNIIIKEIKKHENKIEIDSTSVYSKIRSYKKLGEIYEILEMEDDLLKNSWRFFTFFNKRKNKIYRRSWSNGYGKLVFRLLNNFNANKKYRKSLRIIKESDSLFDTHRSFTCGKGGKWFYTSKGKTFFESYAGAKKDKEALDVAFHYLLNNEEYQDIILELLVSKYSTKVVKEAYVNLKSNFVLDNEVRPIERYFIFIDYKIDMMKDFNTFKMSKSKEIAIKEIESWAFYKALQKRFD